MRRSVCLPLTILTTDSGWVSSNYLKVGVPSSEDLSSSKQVLVSLLFLPTELIIDIFVSDLLSNSPVSCAP